MRAFPASMATREIARAPRTQWMGTCVLYLECGPGGPADGRG